MPRVDQGWYCDVPLRIRRLAGDILLVTLLVFGCVLPAAAQVTYTVFPVTPAVSNGPLEQPTNPSMPSVTLAVQDSTIAYTVRTLVHQVHLRLAYDIDNPVFTRRITVHIANATVMDALALILKGTGLTAKMAPDGETIVVRGMADGSVTARRFAEGVVLGHVTDSASGAGLGGAVVRIEGTKLSAVTSDSGHFVLKNVPAGDQVLSVKLFGYRPAERTVTVADSAQTTVRIVMVPVPTVLSGVVTTAAGQQQRYKVGVDMTVLNVDSILKVAPVSSVTDLLETRVPGLIVQHTTGIPGAPSRLRLRGINSINSSNDPIVIINGIRVYADQSGTVDPKNQQTTIGGGSSVSAPIVGNNKGSQTDYAGPSALDQLDPNSIETIEVLKGPSATAIYGSDAANGVIIITTKHGRVGPSHWNLALDQGWTTLPGSWPMNFYRFCESSNTGGYGGLCSDFDLAILASFRTDSIVPFQALNDPRYSPLTGASGQTHDASLTVSGGSGSLTYSVTGSASSQSGYLHLPAIEQQRFLAFHGFAAPGWMVTPDQYTTYGANSQLTVQLGQTGGTLALTSQIFRSAQQQSSLQNDLAGLSTTYVDTTQLASNPLFPNYFQRAQLGTTTFNNAVSLSNLRLWRWLPPVSATAGLSVQDQNNTTLLPRDYITCFSDGSSETGIGNYNDCGVDSLGSYAIGQGTNTTGTLTGSTLFGQQRLVSTVVGLNVTTQAQSSYSAQTIGLPIGVSVPSSFSYSDGSGPSYATTSTATYGWYVQPTLNFSNRFFASPGFRLDGGSASGTNGGVTGLGGSGGALSLFPKLDLSWVAISRSPSNPMFGALTLLRPRIAFGISGVEPGPGEQLRLLQPIEGTPVAVGGTGTPQELVSLQSLGNTRLHPERDQELEGGVDAQFWNQRLSLSLTGYHKMAYDAILSIPVAPSVNVYINGAGNLLSQSVNIGTIQNTGWEATVFTRLLDSRRIDWSANANISGNHNRLVSLAPGLQPFLQSQAVTGVNAEVRPGYPLFGLWAPPILGFSDANHDGVLEPNEVVVGDSAVFVGAQQPDYELTVSTTVGFFNDRLSITTAVDYQNGLTQQTSGLVLTSLLNTPGLTTAQQAAGAAINATPNTFIGQLQTVNTLRWQSLAINYVVPPRLSHWVGVPNMTIALQGQNLGLHTSYRGKDPNVNSVTSGNQTVDDGNALPQPRVWSLRVTLTH